MAQEKKFTDVFVSSDDRFTGYEKFLSEYLSLVGEDSYISQIFRKIISQAPLTNIEVERIEDLMANVDLNELMVNKILEEGEAEFDKEEKEKYVFRVEKDTSKEVIKPDPNLGTETERRIIAVMTEGEHRLHGWDHKFIFGDDGAGLLNQAKNRNGWLSEKQFRQLGRIEKILGIGGN